MIRKLLFTLFILVYSQLSPAATINVTNHSFESPIQVPDGKFSFAATGWVVTGSSGSWNPTSGQMSQGPTDGNQVGFSNQIGLGLSQTLSHVLTANTQYTLMVDVLSRTDGFTHKSSTLELRTSDDIILASATVGPIAGGLNFLLTASYLAIAGDVNLGKSLKIALLAGGEQSDWDNVRLNGTPPGAVPIPAAVWLFGTALIGLIGFGKRRKAA